MPHADTALPARATVQEAGCFAQWLAAFLSAADGLISALLLTVSNGISITKGMTLAQALGYSGLIVATVLGMRVLIAISRDRII